MYFERTKPQHSLYTHSRERGLSNQLPYSKGRKSIGYYIASKDKKKRIMTEYDEEPVKLAPRKESVAEKHMFHKEAPVKPSTNSVHRVVHSTKHNQSKNDYLKSIYGNFTSKNSNKNKHQSSFHQIPTHNKSVIHESKDKKKSVYLMTTKVGQTFQQLRRKSLSQCKSNVSKQSKQKLRTTNKLENLKVDNINLDRKTFKQETTVKTLKKEQEKDIENKYNLTQQEFELFGQRFPYGYEKIKLLGRGGFSLVWLGEHKKSGKLFAIKQIRTENNHQTHMKQIWFGSLFFTTGGVPRAEFSKHKGIKNLSKMYSYEINQIDTWIYYEKCGASLGSSLYDIRSEKYKNQKFYKIHPKPLYKLMARKPSVLKKLIIQICRALQLLSEKEVVHSDLKTENILIKFDEEQLHQVKLIDYGSSFFFHQIYQFSMATPEYMPYQILNYILCQNQSPYDEQLLEKVKNYKNPWVIDIWSLGCVILQILNGIPLWMSLPLLVDTEDSGTISSYGLFAVKGRGFQEIINNQKKIISNLEKVLLEKNYSAIRIDRALLTVLRGMLEFEPEDRISPKQVIEILSQSLNIQP